MTKIKNEVCEAIDGMRDEITEFLANLVKAKSINPPGDTRQATRVIREKLREFDLKAEFVAVDEDKPNIIARINPDKRPELLFNSHIDTVPLGELDQWEYDPLDAKIVDGIMYGRGVADAKSSVAAMIMAAKTILEMNVTLNGTLIINPVSDEEVGGLKGAKYILDEGYINPDYVVIGEQTDNQIAIVEKGIIWFTIKTIGKTAHASTPWDGVSAIQKMIKLLTLVEERIGAKIKTQRHPLTPPPSMNIGTIKGGVKTNVVADLCEVTIDRRFLPHENPESIIKEFSDIIKELEGTDPDFKVEFQEPLIGLPINTSPDEKIVKIAQHVCEGLNLSSELIGYKQASDGRFFSEKGIPTIILGPSDPKVGHTPNEHVKIDDVITATKIYSLLAINALT
ncbi:MAG: M20 family metallopeptidase [Candidatus Hodarchaeota archaeon]